MKKKKALQLAIWDYLWGQEADRPQNGYMERLIFAYPKLAKKAKKRIKTLKSNGLTRIDPQ